MLPRVVTDGVLKLSLEEREELATVLIESLRDEPRDVEVEIDLDVTDHIDEPDQDDDRLVGAVVGLTGRSFEMRTRASGAP